MAGSAVGRKDRLHGSRRPVVVGTALLFGIYLVITAAPAAVAVTCTQAGAVVTLTLSADTDAATIAVDTGAIEVDGTQCDGTATVNNTDTIEVDGAALAQGLTIDLSGGAFGPGIIVRTVGPARL